MYVICDKHGKIARLSGVRLFGITVTMLACFDIEKDALDVLFNMEDFGVLYNHTVEYVGNFQSI